MELPGVAASVGWLAGPVRVSPAKPSTATATGGGIAIGDGTSSATATSPGAGVSHNGFYSGAVAGAGAGAGATAGGGSSDLPDSLELSGSSDAFHAVLPTRLDGIADALRGVRLTPVLVGMLHQCGAPSLPWLTPPIASNRLQSQTPSPRSRCSCTAGFTSRAPRSHAGIPGPLTLAAMPPNANV